MHYDTSRPFIRNAGRERAGVGTISKAARGAGPRNNAALQVAAFGLALLLVSCGGSESTGVTNSNTGPVKPSLVVLEPATSSVIVGGTVQLTATARDASGTVLGGRTFTWVASNSAIVSVTQSGLATGIAPGSATLTATSDGVSGATQITVLPPIASVAVSPATFSVIAGSTIQLTATLRDASGNVLTGRTVAWTSSSSVATVSSSGLATGVTVLFFR